MDSSTLSVQLHGSFLDRQVQRTNRNLVLVTLFLVAGVATYGFAEWRYLYNFFAGPLEISAERLAAITHPDDEPRYFVTVRGKDSIDTGLHEIERETQDGVVQSETVKAKYSVLIVGKRALLVKAPPASTGAVFQGGLGEIPEDVRSQVVAPLVKDVPEAGPAFLPLMLDATGFRDDGYVALAICIPVLLLAAWLLRKVILRRNALDTHPVIKAASRYGPLSDTSLLLDSELRGNVEKFGKARVTQSWVLLPRTFDLSLCHIPDLIWAYKKVTRHYHYFIPTGKSYEVVMYDRYGQPLQMKAREKKTDALLQLLHEKTPWAVIGYNAELNNTLRTNWGGFVAAVDTKRTGAASAK